MLCSLAGLKIDWLYHLKQSGLSEMKPPPRGMGGGSGYQACGLTMSQALA